MKKLGLFIGIDVYAEFSSLRGAANDANNMAGLFQHRLGFETRVLTHEHLGRGDSIQRTIKSMVAGLADGDMFVFFFAGHGKSPQQLPGVPRDQLLILPDVDRKALEEGRLEGTIGLLWVQSITEKKGLQRAFIIDACRAPLAIEDEDFRDGEANFSFDGEAVYRDMVVRRQRSGAIDSPLVVFSSCLDKQRAIELRGKGQGLFTSSVINVVQSRIDSQQPVRIDSSFEDAVAEQMLSSAKEHGIRNAEQRPLRAGAELCLFDTNDSQNRAQRKLLESFNEQLARGAFDDPIGECARDSLAQLGALNLAAEQLQPLRERYSQALVQRKETLDRDFDTRLIELARKINNTASWLNYLSNNRLHEHEIEAHQAIQDLAVADDAVKGKKRQDDERNRVAAQILAEQLAAKQAREVAEREDEANFKAEEERKRVVAQAGDIQLQDVPQSSQAEDAIGEEFIAKPKKAGTRSYVMKLAAGSLAFALTGLGIWMRSPTDSMQPTTVSALQNPTSAVTEPRAVKDMTKEQIHEELVRLCSDPNGLKNIVDPDKVCEGVIGIPTQESSTAAASQVGQSKESAYNENRKSFVNQSWWRDGTGVRPTKLDDFLIVSLQLAEAGKDSALLDTAHAYATGRGWERDEAKAVAFYAKWLKRDGAAWPLQVATREVVKDSLIETLVQGLARTNDRLDWSSVDVELRTTKLPEADYWRGLIAKCGKATPQLNEARAAFEKTLANPAFSSPESPYRLLAGGLLKDINSPCPVTH